MMASYTVVLFHTIGGIFMGKMYGYVRVSSRDQCEERQLVAMREFGVSERNIYADKLSGKILKGRSINAWCGASGPEMCL